MSDHAFDEGLTPAAPSPPSPMSTAGENESTAGWATPRPIRFNESAGGAEPSLPSEAEPPISSADFPVIDDEESVNAQQPSERAGVPVQDSFVVATDAKLGSESPVQPVFSRLELLTRKIDQYPNAPVNYVLRGEVYLDNGDFERAAADFRMAIALAEQQDETLAWGYVNAAFIDRAEEGLHRIDG